MPEPGDVIAGKYVVQRELGRGGMAAVFVVRHQITGKQLALKCLLPHHLHDAELITRFWREAQNAGRVHHRHVVDIYDIGREGQLSYLIMELLDGKPLSTLLREGNLSIRRGIEILLRTMAGVSAAHQSGVIHRDLKPDNIFVCRGPTGEFDDPKVLDFGISKALDLMSVTRSGVSVGTPLYMSLEQLRGQRDVDARTDVYALGVILYEALSGRPPHVADGVPQLMVKVLTEEPMHLDRVRPDLAPGLADVVMRAVKREREDRYGSVDEFARALSPYGPGTPSSPGLRAEPRASNAGLSHVDSHSPRRPSSPARAPLSGGPVEARPTPRAPVPAEFCSRADAPASTEVAHAAAQNSNPRVHTPSRSARPRAGQTPREWLLPAGLGVLAIGLGMAWWWTTNAPTHVPEMPPRVPRVGASPSVPAAPEPTRLLEPPVPPDAAAPYAGQPPEPAPANEAANEHVEGKGTRRRQRKTPAVRPQSTQPTVSGAPGDSEAQPTVDKRAGQLGTSDF